MSQIIAKRIIATVAIGDFPQEAHQATGFGSLYAVTEDGKVYGIAPNMGGGLSLWPETKLTAQVREGVSGGGEPRASVSIFEDGKEVATFTVGL